MRERMTPSELLATLILGREEAALAAARETEARGLWENAVRLALLWRVVPQLRSRLAALKAAPGNAARESLAMLSAAAAAESAMVCHRAAGALGALEDAGLKAAVFKGLGMIASVYRTPAARMLKDADVLIRQEDFAAATVVLRDAGFRPAISMELDAWLELLEDRVYPVHDFMDFVDDTGVRIDVHWRLRTPAGHGFSIGDILDRSVKARVGRGSVWTVALEDSMLLTAHHLVRDRLIPAAAVKDLSDLSACLESMDEPWSLAELERRARNAGLSTSLLAALRILAEYGASANAFLAAGRISHGCSAKEKKTARRLAAMFTLQLRHGVVSSVAVGMAGATPSLAGRFILSRWRSFADPGYRLHKFPGDGESDRNARPMAFVRALLTLTPSRFAQYRALATETRRYLRSGDSS